MPDVALVADVGGTNCRMAIMEGAPPGRTVAKAVVRVADAPSPERAFGDFLHAAGHSVGAAAIALAGPVAGAQASLTNGAWTFDAAALSRELACGRVLLANDLAAQARALPLAPPTAFVAIGPPSPLGGDIAVVGPGTGLGVARLSFGPPPRVVATEGGHVGFAPNDALEVRLIEALQRDLGRVTNEHVVAGGALPRLHAALTALAGAEECLDAAVIVARAEAGDPTAGATLRRFAAMLGGVCADSALAQGARAVALVGDVPRKLRGWLSGGGFRSAFDARGPTPGFLAAAPIVLVDADDLGLVGAYALLHD